MEGGKNVLSLKTLYIVSMAIAFTNQYGTIMISYYLQIVIGTVWILVGAIKLAHNGFCPKKESDRKLCAFLRIYLLPHVVIHIYTVILMLTGIVDKEYMTTNMTVYVPVLMSVAAMYLFGESAFILTYIALILSWMLSFFCSLFVEGLSIIPNAIRQAYFGHHIHNYLELHDLVFGMGYVFIFVLLSQHKRAKGKIVLAVSSLVVMLLGMKRIQMAALLIVVIICVFFNFISVKKQYCLSSIVCGALFIASYLFVYIMSDTDFVELLASKINMMGRNYYYTTILKLAEFKVMFPGIGRNVVTRILTGRYAYLNVGGVHSDIIKMYVENGFLIFGFWLWYYLFRLRKYFFIHYGHKVSVIYCILIIYTFILYFTDNVETYFITQTINMIVMMTLAFKQSDKETAIQNGR